MHRRAPGFRRGDTTVNHATVTIQHMRASQEAFGKMLSARGPDDPSIDKQGFQTLLDELRGRIADDRCISVGEVSGLPEDTELSPWAATKFQEISAWLIRHQPDPVPATA